MSINFVLYLIGFLTECNCTNNSRLSMMILTSIQSSPIFVKHYLKRRSSIELVSSLVNLTNDFNQTNLNLSTGRFQVFDHLHLLNKIKDGSNFTKTQIRILITVVIIITLIMLIVTILRFRSTSRDQETLTIQTEITRQRASQYSEASSRRGSTGYYTRKYTQTSNTRLDDQLNPLSCNLKRYSAPFCDPPSKPRTTSVILPCIPRESSSSTAKTSTQQQYVIISCDPPQPSENLSISVPKKSLVRKSRSTIGISRPSSSTILSVHRQSRRLILCTVPPHIFCRPNTVRYSLVLNVHDQRQRRRHTSHRYIKVSSPTLRKLCLPCITTRNHHPHAHQQSKKSQTSKNNQQQIIIVPTTEIQKVESIHRVEVAPRTHDRSTTVPVVHSSEYLLENDANHSPKQQEDCEISSHHDKVEKKDNEISVNAEVIQIKVDSESVLPTLSSSGNEITRSNEDDACNDQTPLLTSELGSTIKDSSNRTTRKYSLNAILPLTRSPNPHPFSSSSTITAALGSKNTDGDDKRQRQSVDIKSRHRLSLSSVFCRHPFAKQTQPKDRIIDSTNKTPIQNTFSQTSDSYQRNNQSGSIDSDNTDRSTLSKTKTSNTKLHQRKKSSSITPITSSSSSIYRKDFMQKIERFRFIDDSASSTTTVTSPVESIDRLNSHQPCSHLITSAIEQFDDYVRSRYSNNEEIDSYIDRLNSDILTNGSYSDLNILNGTNENLTSQLPRQQQITFKPVNNHRLIHSETDDYRQIIRNSAPIAIHSPSSKENSLTRPTTIHTNGHSRSMDFPSTKHEYHRPITLTNSSNIYETSSSSLATITSERSSISLEFNDDSKPSGVLVDDDFLPMSSPVDEHFWDMTNPFLYSKQTNEHNECFPNVGSSPDVEIKHFPLDNQYSLLTSSIDQPLSETSCDEDEDVLDRQTYSIHEYKLKELQKPIVIHHRSILNPSIHSNETDLSLKNLSLDHPNDESLLEKFASANAESIQNLIHSPPLRVLPTTTDIISSSQQYPQTIYEEDDTQESSTNDNNSDESADNGEIDLVHEFELSQKQEQITNPISHLWSTNDRDIFILQEDDLLSALVNTQTMSSTNSARPLPPSIMKMTHNKSIDSIDDQQPTTPTATTTNSLKPKVRFNLDPQYEREREWNKVNKLLGNSVEWTDEFEV